MKKTQNATDPGSLAPVSELIREAGQRLSASSTLAEKGGKRSLFDLPLYILAGPAGAGKTTAFLSAGLSPQLLAGHVQQESTILPTALGNLWYASDAVFVEAGGRFFAEDTHEWRTLVEQVSHDKQSFVQQLRSANTRATKVRGIVWFCDITSFLGMPDPGRIATLGRKLREYLLVAGEVLGSSFPVYVVFTKADLVPHFADYFRPISETDSRQVLGCTLQASNLSNANEVYAEAYTKRLTDSFNRLYARLADKRLMLLAREAEGARKPGIYEFPRELKRIRDSLIQFLVEAFRPNPLQPGPLLRGFYFTGMQEVPVASGLSHVTADAVSSNPTNMEATLLFQAKMGATDAARSLAPRGPNRRDDITSILRRRSFPQGHRARPVGSCVRRQKRSAGPH